MSRDRAALLVFFLCAAFLAYGAGFLTSMRNWAPSSAMTTAVSDLENLVVNWRNDFGLEPTRLLVPSNDPERQRISAIDPGSMAPGYRLVSGLAPGRESGTGIALLDESGQEVHFWPVAFGRLSQGDRNPHTVFLHGTLPLPDGSVVVNFDQGDTIARIGPCGNTLWATPGNFHHGIDRSYDGTLWTWENVPAAADGELNREFIVQLDPETGQRLRRISLLDDVIAKHGLFGRFALHSDEAENAVAWGDDPFHPNDVEVLDPRIARAFPMFEAGDLLISLRSLNMVAVVDPESGRIRWSRIGPWHRQHDPDFLPDGTISVLNNNMGVGGSQVMTVDPKTDAIRIVFEGNRLAGFYSWRRGRHQGLPNGNMIIAETEKGRAIEVDRRGSIVWRYENIYDAARNGLVNEALVLPAGFFDDGAFERCRGER